MSNDKRGERRHPVQRAEMALWLTRQCLPYQSGVALRLPPHSTCPDRKLFGEVTRSLESQDTWLNSTWRLFGEGICLRERWV
jgi:hypothetical protein